MKQHLRSMLETTPRPNAQLVCIDRAMKNYRDRNIRIKARKSKNTQAGANDP